MKIMVPPVKRQFLAAETALDDWTQIEPYFTELQNREITSLDEFIAWMKDQDEMTCALQEFFRWKMIRTSCDTENEELKKDHDFFLKEIQPKLDPVNHNLQKKFLSSPFLDQLDPKEFGLMVKRVKNHFDLYREENVELLVKERVLSRKYGRIRGSMMIQVDGENITMHEAMGQLQDVDRDHRKMVWSAIADAFREVRDELETLFDELLTLRHQIAKNAGFDDYRDYKFAALGRFDYNADDCLEMHQTIQTQIIPLVDKIKSAKAERLGLDILRPWDSAVDGTDNEPLKPFDTEDELIERSIECLSQTDQYFADCLSTMVDMKRLDLSARKGKAPGGYNMSLPETGVPFIFMNANGQVRNVKTMTHEAGHAVHSFLSNDLEFYGQKVLTSEIAELAAMSMELFTLENWKGTFFKSQEEMDRAKRYQLKNILELLPWIATIDAFQHWLYTNPGHSRDEREEAWIEVHQRFLHNHIDMEGTGDYEAMVWLKQLHLFQVPFYYIEYGMAQLGAVAMWRNFLQNPESTIEDYKKALTLGYKVSIKEVYKTAGIRFDFSESYIRELADFLEGQLYSIEEMEPVA